LCLGLQLLDRGGFQESFGGKPLHLPLEDQKVG